jgi:hypothetical protein
VGVKRLKRFLNFMSLRRSRGEGAPARVPGMGLH